MTPRRREGGFARMDLLAPSMLLLLVLLFFGSVLFGDDCLVTSNMSRWLPWRLSSTPAEMDRPSFRDDSAQTYFPRRFLSGEELKEGRIPLWNRYVLCGTPHLADFQSCVFHPLNILLLYWVDPLWSMGAFVAIHLFLGGLFLYLFLRRIGVGVTGASIGGISFLFNAYFVTYFGHPVHISTGCWIPLLLLLIHRCVKERKGRILPFAVAMMILGGFPQTILYGFLIAAAYALFLWAGLPGDEKRRGALRLGALAGLALIGIGLTLFQVLPTAELVKLSERQVVPLERILEHHMPVPAELVRLLLPDFFGNGVDENLWIMAIRGPLTHPSKTGFIGYAGIMTLVLAPAGLFFSGRREARFFAGLAALSLLLLFVPFAFTWFYRLVPLAKASFEVHRLQFPFLLALSVLAGLGFDGVRERARRGRWRAPSIYIAFWLLTIPAFGVALFAGGPALREYASDRLVALERERGPGTLEANVPPVARWYFASGHESDWMRFHGRSLARYAIFLGIGGAGILLLRRGGRRAVIGGAALVVVTAADGALFARTYWTPHERESTFAPSSILRSLSDEEDPFRVARVGRDYLLPPNSGLVYGIEDLQGVNALMPADIGRLFEKVDPRLWPDKRRVDAFNPSMDDPLRLPLWSLLNVAAYLAPPPVPGSTFGAPAASMFEGKENLRTIRSHPLLWVRNESALPRAFLRHRFEVAEDREEILRRLVSPGFDPAGPLLLEEDPGIPLGRRAALPGDQCAIAERRGGDVDVRVRSGEPGLLFLSETWYPGWEAEVDGERAPILRAHYAFRAVPVPAGEHVVSFRYRPRSFRFGAIASILALAFWVGIVVRGGRGNHISR